MENHHGELMLREPMMTPTAPMIEQALGDSFAAYEAMQKALPNLQIEQEWQWYAPHKVWAGKGVHRWTTQRGTRKEKVLYWLHVFDGHFTVAVWFKEKNREKILQVGVGKETMQLIANAKTMGKLPTFPVEFKMTATAPLADICALIELKKELEV